MAVFLTLVVGGTGALEMFYYVPTPDQAPLSVQTISYLVPLGGLIRSLHYWSGQFLVGTIIVHLLRVLFTGGYSGTRRFNNLLGVALLGAVILLDFTGYMLRWDQGIQWALVVGTNLLKTIPVIGPALFTAAAGGGELGSAALLRFYAWHVFGLALPFVFFGVWHLFRIRRDGGIAVPPPALRQDHTRISRHELVRREVVAALMTSAVLLAVATLRPAPLGPPIVNMNELTSDALAPWFFLWVQQLLKWGDPFLLGVLLPMAILGSLAALPYLARPVAPEQLGGWFPTSGRAVQIAVGLIALAILVLTALAFMPSS